MRIFDGKALFLNRDDINTDEIIPAKYLTEITKEALKPNLLEDLKLDGFSSLTDIPGKSVVISRKNFGCGSSREHAPWAFEVNGIYVVIAISFARIFRQNMFNCGMMAIELEEHVIDMLIAKYQGTEVQVFFNVKASMMNFSLNGINEEISFTISDYDDALVAAGGWLDYADANY